MKSKLDPRHQLRITMFKSLFEANFKNNISTQKNSQAAKVLDYQKEIDSQIKKYASTWPIDQITPVNLAILRMAIWELLYQKKEPYKVICDEAVEIAKEYGAASSASFINGVLGAIISSQNINVPIEKQQKRGVN